MNDELTDEQLRAKRARLIAAGIEPTRGVYAGTGDKTRYDLYVEFVDGVAHFHFFRQDLAP